jgi:hypothetical protein
LLACGGKATRSSEFDEGEADDSSPLQEDAADVMVRLPEMTSEVDPSSVVEGPLAEPGVACERDADCSTDFCDLGVCWEPHAMAERAGETGAVYAAGHGSPCDRATPCRPYACKEGRCRF